MNRLLKFERPGCTPCSILGNFLDSKSVRYQKVDIEENPLEAQKFGIMSLPVLMVMDEDGTELYRYTGFNPSNTAGVDKAISML